MAPTFPIFARPRSHGGTSTCRFIVRRFGTVSKLTGFTGVRRASAWGMRVGIPHATNSIGFARYASVPVSRKRTQANVQSSTLLMETPGIRPRKLKRFSSSRAPSYGDRETSEGPSGAVRPTSRVSGCGGLPEGPSSLLIISGRSAPFCSVSNARSRGRGRDKFRQDFPT